MSERKKTVANVGSESRGSHLLNEGREELVRHAKQPHSGDPTGAGRNAVAEHHVGKVGSKNFGQGHGIFRPSAATNADRFRGTQNCGALRVSGHSGAHQLGKKH